MRPVGDGGPLPKRLGISFARAPVVASPGPRRLPQRGGYFASRRACARLPRAATCPRVRFVSPVSSRRIRFTAPAVLSASAAILRPVTGALFFLVGRAGMPRHYPQG